MLAQCPIALIARIFDEPSALDCLVKERVNAASIDFKVTRDLDPGRVGPCSFRRSFVDRPTDIPNRQLGVHRTDPNRNWRPPAGGDRRTAAAWPRNSEQNTPRARSHRLPGRRSCPGELDSTFGAFGFVQHGRHSKAQERLAASAASVSGTVSTPSRVIQLEKDLAGLRDKAAKEREKAAKERQAAGRVRGQISRHSSPSSAAAKERDANKAEERAAKHEIKAADYDRQAANKQSSLDTARLQLERTQARDDKRRESGRKRQRDSELKELREIEAARRQRHAIPPWSAPVRAPSTIEQFSVDSEQDPGDEEIFDVCLSFAGEQRGYVELVARALKARGYRVFYDADEEAELWGKDLAEHFDRVYRQLSRACVMFISAEYAQKPWTRHERRSALARALEEDEYVLPARFDETELPGLRPTIKYVDLTDYAPQSLVDLIAEKLGPPRAGAD